MTNEIISNEKACFKRNLTIFLIKFKNDKSDYSVALLIAMALVLLQGCGSGETNVAATNGDGGTGAASACVENSRTIVTPAALASASISNGGKLYDKWYEFLGKSDPINEHPLWVQRQVDPTTGSTNESGVASQWRCKECHGWDYRGVDGAYAAGSSHYTGFKGVADAAANQTPVDIFCAIKSGTASTGAGNHSFSAEAFSDNTILDLTKFISEGVSAIDPSTLFANDKTVILPGANAASGSVLYTNNGCASSSCHGGDGDINSGDELLGGIAASNPWEFIHKIRFGDPSPLPLPNMVSYEGNITPADLADIVLYAQNSLKRSTLTEVGALLGGKLFDNHWSITGNADGVLVFDNPVWANRQPDPISGVLNPRSASETWRCKECHGWDYKGAEGSYGPGNTADHYTGFPSLWARLGTGLLNESNVFSYLKYGVRNPTDPLNAFHKFGEGSIPNLSDSQIESLVAFIFGGVNGGIINTSAHIFEGPLSGGAKGNPIQGKILYESGDPTLANNCGDAACHGPDGRGVDFSTNEFLGDVTNENPWEVLHKARFGQPTNPLMTPVLSWGSDADAADILKYIQDTFLIQP